MSWESTALYYRLANEHVRERDGGLASADLLVRSLDFAAVRVLQQEGRWGDAEELLRREGLALEAAGAQVVLLATNYMHKAAGPLERALSVPFLHLADVVARAARESGATTVGLLGVGATMTEGFYAERLGRAGLDVLVPGPDDVRRVDDAVFGELCRGVFTETTRADLRGVLARLVGRGAQAVALACTELELLLGPQDADVPLLPSSLLHVRAALALGE